MMLNNHCSAISTCCRMILWPLNHLWALTVMPAVTLQASYLCQYNIISKIKCIDMAKLLLEPHLHFQECTNLVFFTYVHGVAQACVGFLCRPSFQCYLKRTFCHFPKSDFLIILCMQIWWRK